MYKLGLDIHGVIDTEPEFFISLAKIVHYLSGEVHIITGVPFNHKSWKKLKKFNNGKEWWDYKFSIVESLKRKRHKGWKNWKGNWHFDDKVWDKEKALYCKNNKINLHIDDTEEYLKHFSTPSFLLKGGFNSVDAEKILRLMIW